MVCPWQCLYLSFSKQHTLRPRSFHVGDNCVSLSPASYFFPGTLLDLTGKQLRAQRPSLSLASFSFQPLSKCLRLNKPKHHRSLLLPLTVFFLKNPSGPIDQNLGSFSSHCRGREHSGYPPAAIPGFWAKAFPEARPACRA